MQSTTTVESIEGTLVKALGAAAAAGRWDIVAQLAKAIEARQIATAGNVVRFDREQKR